MGHPKTLGCVLPIGPNGLGVEKTSGRLVVGAFLGMDGSSPLWSVHPPPLHALGSLVSAEHATSLLPEVNSAPVGLQTGLLRKFMNYLVIC